MLVMKKIIGLSIKPRDYLLIFILSMLDHINMLSMMVLMERLLAGLEFISMKISNNILMFKKDIFSLTILKLSNFMKNSFRHHHHGKNMIVSYVKNTQLELWNSQVVSLILIG